MKLYFVFMRHSYLYILIFSACVGCTTYVSNESIRNAEATLHYADSLEQTTMPYADTALLQSALRVFIGQNNMSARFYKRVRCGSGDREGCK